MSLCNTLDEFWTVITMRDNLGFSYSQEINMTAGGIFDIGTVEACQENSTKYGSISIVVGDIQTVNDIEVFQTEGERFSFAGVPRMFVGQTKLIIPQLNLGENTISEFRVSDGDKWGFHSLNGELTANVTSLENGFASGTFSGNGITVEGENFSLSGQFNLPL